VSDRIYVAPSELEGRGGFSPPVAPEVIHIPPLSWREVPLGLPFRGERSRWDCLFVVRGPFGTTLEG